MWFFFFHFLKEIYIYIYHFLFKFEKLIDMFKKKKKLLTDVLNYPKLIWMRIPQFSLVGSKVLKPRPDRMVWLEKPRTVHFCSSFSLKNHSMRKNEDPYESRLDLTVLRIVIRSVLMVPYFSLNLNPKKNHKKGEKEEDDDEEGVAPWSNPLNLNLK